jgi:phage baseplate assembly protein W
VDGLYQGLHSGTKEIAMAKTLQIKPLLGWPLLPKPVNGQFQWPSLERSVRDLIRVILSTQPGEQLMRPAFGAGLQQFLHEDNTVTLRRRIRDSVSTSLSAYENRIRVDRIDVDPIAGTPSQVSVTITYRLLRTGVVSQMSATLNTGA